MEGVDTVFEYGYDRDRFGGGGAADFRWWFFLYVPGAKLRNQRARQGVVDRGFHFARGGRGASPDACTRQLSEAWDEARASVDYWRGQPSHALGAAGELIPLDEILPELTA